jgi:hypothetical protein
VEQSGRLVHAKYRNEDEYLVALPRDADHGIAAIDGYQGKEPATSNAGPMIDQHFH